MKFETIKEAEEHIRIWEESIKEAEEYIEKGNLITVRDIVAGNVFYSPDFNHTFISIIQTNWASEDKDKRFIIGGLNNNKFEPYSNFKEGITAEEIASYLNSRKKTVRDKDNKTRS